MQLCELEEHGVLCRTVYPGLPLKVEYFLTDTGHSIMPIIASLDQWGYANRHLVADKEIAKEEYPGMCSKAEG